MQIRGARNQDAADAQYLALISRFPSSPRVPTAMYKRALHLQSQKKTAEAKRLFQDIIKRFPRARAGRGIAAGAGTAKLPSVG